MVFSGSPAFYFTQKWNKILTKRIEKRMTRPQHYGNVAPVLRWSHPWCTGGSWFSWLKLGSWQSHATALGVRHDPCWLLQVIIQQFVLRTVVCWYEKTAKDQWCSPISMYEINGWSWFSYGHAQRIGAEHWRNFVLTLFESCFGSKSCTPCVFPFCRF